MSGTFQVEGVKRMVKGERPIQAFSANVTVTMSRG